MKTDNLTDFLTDVADAIRTKKGTSEPINPQDFSAEIASIEGGDSVEIIQPEFINVEWTGHADVEGLKAIGWDDNDIAYFQQYGVNWNEEDDDAHKVSEENKAIYGLLTANNLSSYKNNIVYLPKIDTSARTSFGNYFANMYWLEGIPYIDT